MANQPLNELAIEAYRNSADHGFHDQPVAVGDAIALMHTELSEAYEEWRSGRGIYEVYCDDTGKPCGYPIELADLLIRVFDHAGDLRIDLDRMVRMKMDYNRTRPYKHGGKRT